MSETNRKQPEMHYNFFHVDLWTSRIGSIDNALDATVRVLRGVLVTVDGFTVEKLAKLIHEAGGEDYTQLVADLIATQSPTKRASLIAQIEKDMEKTGAKPFWFLNHMLRRFVEEESLSLSTTQQAPAIAEFEMKQLLNLYMLWNTLNNFFWNAVVGLMKQSLAEHSVAKSVPPLHLIRDCFRSVALDIEIIQRAITQRRRDLKGGNYATPLIVMDQLALKAMTPIAPHLTNSTQINAITFLSEKTHIHHLPYTDQFILIGLSYDRISQDTYYPGLSPTQSEPLPAFELMAIPHEVGHYVYYHATLPNATLPNGTLPDATLVTIAVQNHQTFADVSKAFQANRYYRWCEEIFADTYGCMVAGALSVLGLQALLVSSSKRDSIWEDDEEHPVTAVRPYILSDILRVWSEQKSDRYQFATVADQLDENWSAILHYWGYELLDVTNGRPNRIKRMGASDEYLEQIINVDTLLATVRPIIDAYVRLLNAVITFAPQSTTATETVSVAIPWSHGNVQSLTQYNQVMTDLTDHQFAAKHVPNHHLIDAHYSREKFRAPTADEQLQRCLDYWGDSGPHGWGEH